MISGRAAPSWVETARELYLVAMAVFVVNIVIGILNGADVVEFDRNEILTHVHAGTIGWLTLTIVASTFLLFRAADRRLMLALAVLVPIYVLAFYTGSLPFRAVGGVALLIAIVWLFWWVWQQYLGGERTLPRLAVTLGLTSFGYGAVVGVLLQVSFAARDPRVRGVATAARSHRSRLRTGDLRKQGSAAVRTTFTGYTQLRPARRGDRTARWGGDSQLRAGALKVTVSIVASAPPYAT
jgi:hypothetical protein